MQYTAAKKTLSTEMLITVDENEYTHVFAGEYNGDIIPNPLEVSEVERIGVESLRQELDNSSSAIYEGILPRGLIRNIC